MLLSLVFVTVADQGNPRISLAIMTLLAVAFVLLHGIWKFPDNELPNVYVVGIWRDFNLYDSERDGE